ncbi:hypothetical protein [Myceligenerans cantabricum]
MTSRVRNGVSLPRPDVGHLGDPTERAGLRSWSAAPHEAVLPHAGLD